MDRPSFGSRIKQLRRKRGMSQKKLAEAVGIDFSYLSKIEWSKVPPPSEKVVLRMAEELGVDKDELLVLANRAPSDIGPVITQAPYIPAILRRARGLSREDWQRIDDLVSELKAEKGRHK